MSVFHFKASAHKLRRKSNAAGFTILELIVSLAIFAILAVGVLGSYAALSKASRAARDKTVISSLASNYMEIVRNMPYSQIGTLHGNPSGNLADSISPLTSVSGGVSYKIYYEAVYIHDAADPNPIAVDYKQVKVNILNTQTGKVSSFVTTVVPQNLNANPATGALQIKVLNSVGQPVSGANINITYPTTTPVMNINRLSDSGGVWTELGLAPAVNNYHILVTKGGYSSDQTYAITAANPNPVNPDPTVVAGQITQVTFLIDALSSLTIKTLDQFCAPLSGIGIDVSGAKLIGTNPDVPKFSNSYVSAGGQVVLNNLEWDTYTPTTTAGQIYVVTGTSPIQKIDVLPGTNQTFSMIFNTNSTANSLLVIVKDASTGTALEGAYLNLHKGGSVPQDYYATTGGSVWVQNDWTGGSGQDTWSTTTPDMYLQDSGTVDVNSVPTGIRLKKTSGRYAASGWLESSTFNTGTGATNFTNISWQPTSQNASTTLEFQVAANNDNATWNYVGPDGTAGSYFTTPGASLPSSLDNNQYLRYKVYLSTNDDKYTPILTSVNFNYVSGCYTPGQAWFGDLTAGNNYDLTVSLTGYQTQVIPLNIGGYQIFQVLMTP